MKKFLLSLFILLSPALLVNAQSISPDVIASAGDYFSNGSISISWTLGEIATETIGNGSIILTQGFQQPNYGIVGVPKINDKRFEIKAFPNPTSDLLKIQVKGNESVDLTFELYDAIGRVLITKKLEAGTALMEVEMTKYLPGMYYLKFSDEQGQTVQTYQISKLR
jgi:hypothetical protein